MWWSAYCWARRILAASLLVACAAPPPVAPKRQAAQDFNDVRSASRSVALALAGQLDPKGTLRVVQLGPVVSADSGEMVRSGSDMQTLIMLDLQGFLPGHHIKRLDPKDTDSAWVISGVVRYAKPTTASEEGWFKVELSASDPTGRVMPVVPGRINPRQFDPTPSRFFQESAIYFVDSHTRQRSEFAMLDGGQVNMERRKRFLLVEAGLDAAVSAYEDAKYTESERLFEDVAKLSSGNMTALFGYYQSLLAQKRFKDAELALAAVIDAGIQEGSLSFRIFFRVGSAEFRDDLPIAMQYPVWLSVIAKRLAATDKCLKVEGHTSKTGSADYNEALSLRRAKRIADLITDGTAPAFRKRLSTAGAGFRKNIIGSGSDDAADAVDRRVEFLLQKCGA